MLSGEKITVANTLRLQTNCEIVAMYKKYMDGTGQSSLKFSDSTVTRILNSCPAEKRKSIQGLDYFISDGLEVTYFPKMNKFDGNDVGFRHNV